LALCIAASTRASQQCLSRLRFWETHNTLENVRRLHDTAVVSKLSYYQNRLILDVIRHLCTVHQVCKHQIKVALTLPDDKFVHLVGTVNGKPTHIYIRETSSMNGVTVTVATVESNHDVDSVFLTNISLDVGYFVMDYLDKTASSFSHLPAERTQHPVWLLVLTFFSFCFHSIHLTSPMPAFIRSQSSKTTTITMKMLKMMKCSWPGEWHDSKVMYRIRRKLKIKSRSNEICFELQS
jgi:hypothetical protein